LFYCFACVVITVICPIITRYHWTLNSPISVGYHLESHGGITSLR
jgi:hypothetical protein